MTLDGDEDVLGKIRRTIKYAKKDASDVTKEYAEKLQQTVRKNASGRPGPNIITGQYVGSIEYFVEDEFTAGARTAEPYAARLEYGFSGIDSIGRTYNQPPFPHWTPARDQIAPEYIQAMNERATRWWA